MTCVIAVAQTLMFRTAPAFRGLLFSSKLLCIAITSSNSSLYNFILTRWNGWLQEKGGDPNVNHAMRNIKPKFGATLPTTMDQNDNFGETSRLGNQCQYRNLQSFVRKRRKRESPMNRPNSTLHCPIHSATGCWDVESTVVGKKSRGSNGFLMLPFPTSQLWLGGSIRGNKFPSRVGTTSDWDNDDAPSNPTLRSVVSD